MGLDTTTASAALQEDYQPAIREQLNNINVVLAQIEKNTTDVEGLEAMLSLHITRNSGVGARGEGGTLPTAGNQGYTNQKVPVRRNYGRIQVSGPVIRAMRTGSAAWVKALDSETKGVVTDLKKDVNRQANGTSDGVIGQLGTTTASTTIVASNFSAVQMRQIENGMVIDIGTVANPVLIASAVTVSAVNRVAKTFVVSGGVLTTSSIHFVFRSGSGGSGVSQLEITGLETIVSATGTLFNVDPTVVDIWKSQVYANGAVLRAPTEDLFEIAMDDTNIASGETSWLVVTSHGVARNFAAQLTAQRRFTNTVELNAGFKAQMIDTPSGTCNLVTDRDAPVNVAKGLATNHLIEYRAADWEFMSEDGAVLSRVQNKDAYEATLFMYHELATDERNAHFRIADLAEI